MLSGCLCVDRMPSVPILSAWEQECVDGDRFCVNSQSPFSFALFLNAFKEPACWKCPGMAGGLALWSVKTDGGRHSRSVTLGPDCSKHLWGRCCIKVVSNKYEILHQAEFVSRWEQVGLNLWACWVSSTRNHLFLVQ